MKEKYAVVLTIMIISVAVFLTACKRKYMDVPLAEFEQRQHFTAVVEMIYIETYEESSLGRVVIIGLRTDIGDRISIGGEHAGDELFGFAHTLEKGKRYEFPEAWLAYRARYSKDKQSN
jgi:hypothetical protein